MIWSIWEWDCCLFYSHHQILLINNECPLNESPTLWSGISRFATANLCRVAHFNNRSRSQSKVVIGSRHDGNIFRKNKDWMAKLKFKSQFLRIRSTIVSRQRLRMFELGAFSVNTVDHVPRAAQFVSQTNSLQFGSTRYSVGNWKQKMIHRVHAIDKIHFI